jgi:hypothetical protein
VVVEGAVCACDEPVEVDGVCDKEVVELGVVADWLVDAPVAVEFCTHLNRIGRIGFRKPGKTGNAQT